MKGKFIAFIMLILSSIAFGQENPKFIEGKVTYITSQNIYLKFETTEDIVVGDTLFFNRNGQFIPALLVKNKSSISCVSKKIADLEIAVDDIFYAKQKRVPKNTEDEKLPLKHSDNDKIEPKVLNQNLLEVKREEAFDKKPVFKKHSISGRVAVSSYSNFSNNANGSNHRMRYSFSLNARNFSDSRLSFETYMSYVNRDTYGNQEASNLFKDLKIYSLALKYEAKGNLTFWLGRKINTHLSSLGAIDGIQVEKKFKSIYTGAFIGTRPDYTDYGFNFDLLEYGAYIGYQYKYEKYSQMNTTFAFAEQKNKGYTDRRFAYLQHYHSFSRKLSFFGTAEVELFQNIDNNPTSTFNLGSLYLLFRYKAMNNLTFSFSYSTRKNVIYYETYKDFVQQLIEDESLQGFRLQIYYRPSKKLSFGIKGSYRSRKNDPKASKNIYAYMSYRQIPGIKATLNLSATYLETQYVKGNIYSLGLSKDLLMGKVYIATNYRFVNNDYSIGTNSFKQHVVDFNFSWRIAKKFMFSTSFEGVFQDSNRYYRLYLNLTKRF